MKQTFNYCPVMNYEEELKAYPQGLTGFLQKHNLDGIELLIYDDKGFEQDFTPHTIGVHLQYWPDWLGFWRGEQLQPDDDISAMFGIAEPTRDAWLESVRGNLRAAAKVQPEYYVWHVAQSTVQETYTKRYAYTDEQVIDATIEVVREVAAAIPSGVQLLFENLWHSGLTMRNPAMVDKLLCATSQYHADVGLMLDTGHLMNTNPTLKSEAEGLAYVLQTVHSLGANKGAIQGLHLNCSLSGAYQRTLGQVPQYIDLNTHMVHITSIDQHKSFRKVSVAPLLELVQPQYVTHELAYATMQEMDELLTIAGCSIMPKRNSKNY